MGRPHGSGAPAFRFNLPEVTEMEAILKDNHNSMPPREVIVGLAEKFSQSAERKGKFVVQWKQVWNWFQNKRYANRTKASARVPTKLTVSPMIMNETTPVRDVPQSMAIPMSTPVPTPPARGASDAPQVEFEAKSARDGAWYDVSTFLSHRNLDTEDPEVLVRFSGFGVEEDEWVNIRKHVRQRSLPCEASECVAVLPGDLILCFQEGKEQALYFDAHVLDAQRRRHDVRGCRCRFLVRYDHDESEEIVPLRKVCRRPETDYRLQQLYAANNSAAAGVRKAGKDPSLVNKPSVEATATQQQQAAKSVSTVVRIPVASVPSASAVAMNVDGPTAVTATTAIVTTAEIS
ncbi:hypothetical protein MLD38_000620 [Melastoma candidum]|uniref:Uncharacterized protein n=1 Tax=Melastoma candidum TaxID=119954 RepID=A0ACB9SFL6_9MYRT|nr:hypothetical protein MLD38_000620 [Melastoma candidum]